LGKKVKVLITPEERQAFCDYLNREKKRHFRDIRNIDLDLERFAKIGVFPRDISIDDWIDI